jgi:membrane protein
MKRALRLLKEAFSGWNDDNAQRLGASLSYYTLFSLAPVLVIAIGLAGLVFGQKAAQGQIQAQLAGLVGEQSAQALEGMVNNSRQAKTGIVASLVAFVTLVLGATGVFVELKSALNDIWKVQPPPGASGIRGFIRTRLISLAMVMAVGFLLIVSLVASAALAAAQGVLAGWLPGWDKLVWVLNELTSVAVISALFALLFKYLPDAPIAWKDVWVGAAITSILFTIGKTLIGLYLGKSSVASVYGAAGSVVIVVIWVYYAAQIFYFGAELTQAYAHRHGSRRGEPKPSPQQPVQPRPA